MHIHRKRTGPPSVLPNLLMNFTECPEPSFSHSGTLLNAEVKLKMLKRFKHICQFFFVIIFLWFSFYSVREFVEGKVVFNIIKTKADGLNFPDITVCPRQEKSLAYLKTKNIRNDFNLDPADIKEHKILLFIQNISDTLIYFLLEQFTLFKILVT